MVTNGSGDEGVTVSEQTLQRNWMGNGEGEGGYILAKDPIEKVNGEIPPGFQKGLDKKIDREKEEREDFQRN